MSANCNLIVFTDLDGTLIDHETYRWDAAQPALNALQGTSSGLVLASSKTAAEMGPLRAKMRAENWPAIVENGAGVLEPHVTMLQDSTGYESLRSALEDVPPNLRRLFRGFGDVSAAEVAQMTGLTLQDAALAQQRGFSEPGQWTGTQSEQEEFLAQLGTHGISAQQGGRFLTLSFGRNKVDQMRRIIETYQPRHTIALGDAPNDVAMLEHADFAVVIANPHHPPLAPLKREAEGHIVRTTVAGPAGWNVAILDLLDRLELR
ncbi:MAG: HAD-IIB family hydrolase [Paracoccaceae bacterium]|nr:HAD-IIB family hydrolase [Paracoccaceae bacterium]